MVEIFLVALLYICSALNDASAFLFLSQGRKRDLNPSVGSSERREVGIPLLNAKGNASFVCHLQTRLLSNPLWQKQLRMSDGIAISGAYAFQLLLDYFGAVLGVRGWRQLRLFPTQEQSQRD
jgi:hypothetical protein